MVNCLEMSNKTPGASQRRENNYYYEKHNLFPLSCGVDAGDSNPLNGLPPTGNASVRRPFGRQTKITQKYIAKTKASRLEYKVAPAAMKLTKLTKQNMKKKLCRRCCVPLRVPVCNAYRCNAMVYPMFQ